MPNLLPMLSPQFISPSPMKNFLRWCFRDLVPTTRCSTLLSFTPPFPMFTDLRARLLLFESQIATQALSATHDSTTGVHHTAFLSSLGRGNTSCGGRDRRSSGGRSDFYSNNNGHRGCDNHTRGCAPTSPGILGHQSSSAI